MKKKTSKKSEPQAVKEVVEQAVAQIAETREAAQPTAQTEAAPEAPKKRRCVEFKCLTDTLEHATEKAQLLAFFNDKGEEVKFWLSKALSHFVADGDEPGMTICQLPAWLYYKTGLDKYFPITRWFYAAV